jgi:hypothetical protein
METRKLTGVQQVRGMGWLHGSALLFAGMLIASANTSVHASMQGAKDPSKVPIAAVDRFSDKAAHLQLRTASNGLPGPNKPVDFDTGSFITQGLSPDGKPVRYYNFDVQGTTPAPVYVLYREGEAQPVKGQLDIIDTLPGEMGYNDFRQVWKVIVPRDYQANTLTDAAEIRNGGYPMKKTDTLRNMPVVPDKSVARKRLKGDSAALQSGWYQGKVAKYFSFNETNLSAGGSDTVPVSPIYVTFNVNPDKPNGGPGSGFKTESGSKQTHNVPSTLPGEAGYSPLWLVSVYDNSDWPMVHNLDTVLNAKILAPAVATVNCPVVSLAP